MRIVQMVGGPLDGWTEAVCEGPLAGAGWEGEVGIELLAPGDRIEYREHRYRATGRTNSRGMAILEYVGVKMQGNSDG